MDDNNNGKVILYKCPYCAAGRFTKEDGWNAAVKHIREKHSESSRKGKRSNARRKTDRFDEYGSSHHVELFVEEDTDS